jgi:hypothetical protein
MKHTALRNCLGALLALALVHSAFAADRVELTDGSVVLGKLLSAEAGKLKFETAFAGTIEIAQDKVRSFSTDEAVNVQLAAGSTVLGKVAMTDAGIAVVAADGSFNAPTGKVTAVWRSGQDSPVTRQLKEQIAKNERKWAYEAGVAITGRTGGSEKFSGVVGLKATLESAQDKLIFALQAEKAKDNGVETANRQFGSADYSAFFSDKNVWYVRTSLEKDSIKALDLRSNTSFGFGRKLVKKELQDLELRVGLSYVYENYTNGTRFDSPGLDVTVIHAYTFKTGKLNNVLSYTPAFKNFSNYRLHHESTYEIPITASLWKLKTGVSNDYTSIPQPGVERLDTLYFTSLILNWK